MTISHGSSFMTYSAGFDNRDFLPPFLPVLRNQDGLFGVTLRKCFEEDAIGHLPYTILHDPPEVRRFDSDAVWRSAGETHFTSIAASCIGSAPTFSCWDARKKMRTVGEYLMELGALPPGKFESVIRPSFVEHAAQWSQAMEVRLESANLPLYWAEDVKRAVAHVKERITTEEYIVPSELQIEGRDSAQAMLAAQHLLAGFGKLLTAWPELVEAAKDMDRKWTDELRR